MSKFLHCARFPRLSAQRGAAIFSASANPPMRRKQEVPMKTIPLALLAVLTMSAAAGAAPPSQRSVSLTQDPLIMRLNKDEFRIAFGINGERCGANGCSGMIRYRVDWKTADGTTRSEIKSVGYSVAPLARRTIGVPRPPGARKTPKGPAPQKKKERRLQGAPPRPPHHCRGPAVFRYRRRQAY